MLMKFQTQEDAQGYVDELQSWVDTWVNAPDLPRMQMCIVATYDGQWAVPLPTARTDLGTDETGTPIVAPVWSYAATGQIVESIEPPKPDGGQIG